MYYKALTLSSADNERYTPQFTLILIFEGFQKYGKIRSGTQQREPNHPLHKLKNVL